MKKFILNLIILILGLSIGPCAYAQNSYITESYTSHINVSPEREYRYTTQLDFNFMGTVQSIPFSITGKSDTSTGKIDNINVFSEKHKVTKKGSTAFISITDKGEGFSGKKRIKLGYNIHLTKDKEKTYDFVYLTLVEAMESTVTNAYVTVTLPTDKIEAVEITSATDKKSWNYIKENNQITVTASDLEPGEKLYLTVKMPEGAFKGAPLFIMNRPVRFGIYITLFAFLVLLYIVFVFVKFGLDGRIIYEFETYPPENLSPVETEYAYTRTVSDKSCGAMVLYWATKGYLKIVQHTGNTYTLLKLKDIKDAEPDYCINAFNALFELGSNNEVTGSDLENNYYQQVERLKSGARSAFIKEKVLDNSKSGKFSLRCMLLLLLSGMFTLLMTGILNKSSFSQVFVSWLLFIISSLVLYRFFKFAANKVYNNSQLSITGLITTLISFFVSYVLGSFINISNCLSLVLLVIVLGILIAFQAIAALISRKTDYAARIMGQIKGFKHFLKHPKAEVLEELNNKNSTYFYEMLPYVIMFGYSERWGEAFKNISVLPCDFYEYQEKSHNPPHIITKRLSDLVTLISEKSFSYYRIKTNTQK